MIALLLLVPSIAGLIAFTVKNRRWCHILLVLTACFHTAATVLCWINQPSPVLNGWLALDAIGLLILSIISMLFLAVAVYTVGYLKREDKGKHLDFETFVPFVNAPENVFCGCLLLFLAMMSMVSFAQHFGILWVAIEATSLTSAPLIYFHRQERSLEAAWKYLLICSVGIALALLGNYFLAVAFKGQHHVPLIVGNLVEVAANAHKSWLKAAFIFILVGYGTKMGLAPLHSWLPDSYSEAPSLVSALLSGALENCAFLGILRAAQVLIAGGEGLFVNNLLIGFGLLSMGFAAVFILNQTDIKRMLAYSSVEHMGILALGVGLGGAGIFGSFLHALNHAVTKAMLFLLTGNILACYYSKNVGQIRGLLKKLPVSGVLWVIGFLAITGSPPFGIFISEFLILKAAVDQGYIAVAVTYLVCLIAILVGMVRIVFKMTQGATAVEDTFIQTEPLLSIVPPMMLCAMVIILGICLPPFLNNALHQAAGLLGGY